MTRGIPEGLRAVTPQLSLEGCAEAIEFYKKAFGAVETGHRAPDPSGKKVWHATIQIGDCTLFLNDTFPEMESKPTYTSMWLYSDDVDAAFKRATGAGCKTRMAVTEQFWGDKMGVVEDRWGNRWNLAQRVKNLTPDEMQKAGEAFAKSQKK